MWDSLTEWLHNLLISYHLKECEILFGIPYTNSIDLQAFSFLVFFTKGFFNRKEPLKLQLYFLEFLSELKVKQEAIILA